VRLQPVVIVWADPEAQDVNRTVLTRKPGSQFLGDEEVAPIDKR
jgi:hypothetical protein